jgi:aspartokinase
MTKEDSLTKNVWKILDRKPSITRNINDGIISFSLLARYLIKEENLDATLDSVISAIRRYKLDNYNTIFEKAFKTIKKTTQISTRSPLVNISVMKDTEVQNIISTLFSIIHYNSGDVLRIIQGEGSIKIIVDEKNLKKTMDLFSEKQILRVDKELGEITVHMHADGKYTPGVLALQSYELALNGINLLEAMSCWPEWIWFVHERDLQKAYNILYTLWKD